MNHRLPVLLTTILALLSAAGQTHAQPRETVVGPDAAVLAAEGIEPTLDALRSTLDSLASRPVDDAYGRIVLHAARLARTNDWGALARPLMSCYLRLECSLLRPAVARELGAIAFRNDLPHPSVMLRSANPAAILLGLEILAANESPDAAELIRPVARARQGRLGLRACELLKQLQDPAHVEIALGGLQQPDPSLRLGYLRLLEPAQRPGRYEVFAAEAARRAALTGPAEPAEPIGAPAVMATHAEPQWLVDLTGRGHAPQPIITPIRLARRLGVGGPLLVVAPTRVWVQDDTGALLWRCQEGLGPQNDAYPLGDGTYVIADGGGFDTPTPEATSRLYVFSPRSREVLWQRQVETPQSARPGPAGTWLVARGEFGLAWLDAARAEPVRELAFDAPCNWAEALDNGDAILAVGNRVVRASPAGAVTWSLELPARVTSVVAEAEGVYLAAVEGAGVLRIDATDSAAPTTETVVEFATDSSGFITQTP